MRKSSELQGIFCAMVFVIIVTLVVGSDDYNDAQVDHEYYCEMVELWNTNIHLPPDQRPGWPPYKGECDGA